MGMVISFPEARRVPFGAAPAPTPAPSASASIVILPVIRIERHQDDTAALSPETGAPSGGRKRRPGRRS